MSSSRHSRVRISTCCAGCCWCAGQAAELGVDLVQPGPRSVLGDGQLGQLVLAAGAVLRRRARAVSSRAPARRIPRRSAPGRGPRLAQSAVNRSPRAASRPAAPRAAAISRSISDETVAARAAPSSRDGRRVSAAPAGSASRTRASSRASSSARRRSPGPHQVRRRRRRGRAARPAFAGVCAAVSVNRVVCVEVGHQWVEAGDLCLRRQHRVVRPGEVLVVLDQPANPGLASGGSSMWSRTKSVRLPTDFIDTVWWNRSSACSGSIPNRRRKSVP